MTGGLDGRRHGNKVMIDLIYLATVAAFFVAAEFYAHWCGKL